MYLGIDSTIGRSLITLVHSSVFVVSGSLSSVLVRIGTSSFLASSLLGVIVGGLGCLTEILTGGLGGGLFSSSF